MIFGTIIYDVLKSLRKGSLLKILKRLCSMTCLILINVIILSGCKENDSVTVYKNDTSDTNRESTLDKINHDNLTDMNESAQNKSSTDQENTQDIYIQVCGAVNQPGVYKVRNSLRVYEVIEIAGGVTGEAATDVMNLASVITDEMKIYVPSKKEVEEGNYSSENSGTLSEKSSNSDKININSATLDMLMQLPGIGEAKATAIITYREQNGKFKCIEDVMNISGIKESAFNKIKDLIVV